MLAHLSWCVFPGSEGEQAGLCQVAQMFGDNPQGWDLGALCPPSAAPDGWARFAAPVCCSEQGSLKVFLLTSFIWECCQPVNLQIFVPLAGGS